MRKILIAMAAITLSAAPAHAQFENFFGSNGFAGFDGNNASAGCVSGASGMGMMGMGGTVCNSNAGGDYQNQSYSVQGGTFDGSVQGGFSNNGGTNNGISSIWNSDGGEKTGGNSIVSGGSSGYGAGVQYEGNVWGSFEQGSASSFSGSSNVNTTSWFTLGGGFD